MKKNKFLKLASGLLVLCLLTTCVISTTFAKYVTNDSASDTARVAKWGVVIDVQADTAFGNAYDDEVNASGTKVVSTEDVVAPGTKGTLAMTQITGKPEVKVNIEYKATLTLTGWEVAGAFYCPLEITIDGNTYKGTAYASIAEFKAAVEGAVTALTKDYAAGTDLSEANETFAWAWAFEGNDDVKDTKLGDDAAAGSGSTIKFELTVTATQID